MVKESFKQIDLLRKRRDSNYFLVEPDFINKRKYINISPGLIKTKMQDQICKIDEKKISSVKKFKNLNRKNKVPMPDQVAENILNFLQSYKINKNGEYQDIRKK